MFGTISKQTKYKSESKNGEVITTDFITKEIKKNKKQILAEIKLLKNTTFKKIHDEVIRMIMIKIDEFILEQVKIEIEKLYAKNIELNDTLRKSMVENDKTLVSMIDRLRVEMFENVGLCEIV